MQYIDPTKIESYNVTPQTPSVGIVYNPSGTYYINQQSLTQAQVIAQYDLVLISNVFYTKPKVIIVMSKAVVEKKFADDATLNSWVASNLTPLTFLAV